MGVAALHPADEHQLWRALPRSFYYGADEEFEDASSGLAAIGDDRGPMALVDAEAVLSVAAGHFKF